MVVSPWGEIINKLGTDEGYFICDIDFDYVDSIREQFPFLKHKKKLSF